MKAMSVDFPVPGCPFTQSSPWGSRVQATKDGWLKIQEHVRGCALEDVSWRRSVIEGKYRECRHAGTVSCHAVRAALGWRGSRISSAASSADISTTHENNVRRHSN
jgi:hypothetical protein